MTKRRRSGARTAATLLFLGVAVSACSLFDLNANPCPDPASPLVCPNQVCCPNGSPYECGGKCYTTPSACGSSYVTCTGGTATPEIAGVHRDSGQLGGLLVDKEGEMLAVTVDRDAQGNATRVNGAVYTNASVSIAVFLGPDGLPTKTVIGDFVLLFANWNLVAKTVDVAKIYADTGYIEIVRRVPIDASGLASDSVSSAQSSSALRLESTCFPSCSSVKKNLAETFKISALILSAAACGEATAMSLGAMAIPCAGALVHAATLLAGDEAWVDDGEQTGLVLGAIGCTEGNPLECVSTAYGFIGAFLGTAESVGSSGDLATANGALANPSVRTGIVQQGGGLPACGTNYECNPYAYMPCYPDGTKQCSASCTWGVCPTSSGGCPGVVDCAKGTHQVGCDCVSNGGGGGGGGGTCPDGSSCDPTGGHVCCGCADGSYMCLLPGLCAQGC